MLQPKGARTGSFRRYRPHDAPGIAGCEEMTCCVATAAHEKQRSRAVSQ